MNPNFVNGIGRAISIVYFIPASKTRREPLKRKETLRLLMMLGKICQLLLIIPFILKMCYLLPVLHLLTAWLLLEQFLAREIHLFWKTVLRQKV